MKNTPVLLIYVALAVAACGQTRGLFVAAGPGVAVFDAGKFTQTTAYGEALQTTDETDKVSSLQASVGYVLGDRWDVQVQYTDYGAAEVSIAFPQYPGMSGLGALPLPAYSRNVVRYDTWRVAFVPSYTLPLGKTFRLRAGAGISRTRSTSHCETRYYAWFSGRPSGEFSDVTSSITKTSWSYIVAASLEYAFADHWSLSLSGSYAPFKIAVPPTNVIIGGGTRPSKRSVTVSSLEATLAVMWRR